MVGLVETWWVWWRRGRSGGDVVGLRSSGDVVGLVET